MSATAAWFAKATPIASVAGAVVLALGIVSIVHAAITLALQGAAWNFFAYACLSLAGVLALSRLRAVLRRTGTLVFWDTGAGAFRVAGVREPLTLHRAWRGAAWVTLELRPQAPRGRTQQLVIWKSAMPAPLWNELVLRVQAARSVGNSHQNKERP